MVLHVIEGRRRQLPMAAMCAGCEGLKPLMRAPRTFLRGRRWVDFIDD